MSESRTASADSGLEPALAREIVGRILAITRPQRVILFGSRARGDADPRSDIDVAVAGPAMTREEWLRVLASLGPWKRCSRFRRYAWKRLRSACASGSTARASSCMSNPKLADSLTNLGRALERLREGLDTPQAPPLVVDGTNQRFEFVVELFWKTLKRALAAEGIETTTPREALQRAYQAGWLQDEASWLSALRDRNETSHVYDEAAARAIYTRVRTYWPEFQRCYAFLWERFGSH